MAHWETPRVSTSVAWRFHADAWVLALHPTRRRSDALPVIGLHGWPQAAGRTHLLGLLVHPSNVAGILAAGHPVYFPFTGSNWGASAAPGGVGAGNAGIDAAVALATADGHSGPVHLFGTSMGGCNALNWAWRNPTGTAGVYLVAPAVDLTGTGTALTAIGDSIAAAHPDGYGAFDAVQNVAAVAPLADRISAFGARDDELVPWASLAGFAADAGFPLEASAPEGEPGGGHFFQRQLWSDLAPARHFRAVESAA